MRRAFRSIRFLLPATLFLLIAVVLFAAAELGSRRFGAQGTETRAHWIGSTARLVASNLATDLERGNEVDLEKFLRGLRQIPELTDALLVDPNGIVVGTARAPLTGHAIEDTPLATDAAVIRAAASAPPDGVRIRHGLRYVLVIPVRTADAAAGTASSHQLVLDLDLSRDPQQARSAAYRFFGLVAVAALAVLLLVAAFLHRAVAAPAHRLAAIADRFAAGDRRARARIEGADEIRRAGEAFNRLAERLGEVEPRQQAQQRLLDTLLRGLPLGVIALRRSDQQILFLNRAWQEIEGPGFEPGRPYLAALEGLRFFRFDGTPLPVEELPLGRTLRSGQPTEILRLQVERTDGVRTTVLMRAMPLALGENGEIDAVLGMSQSQTELERAFAELRRSERQLEALLASVSVGVVMLTSSERRVLFCNPRFNELTGRTFRPGDLYDEALPTVERADGQPYTTADGTMSAVIRDGLRHTRADLLVVNGAGERIPVLVSSEPVHLEGGTEADAVVTVMQDRRDLEHALEELREWEHRFERATRATGQAIYEWDRGNDRYRFSGALESVFGWRSDEVDDNTKWNERTHPDDVATVALELEASLRERRPFDCVYRFRHRDGRWLWVRERGIQEFDDSERPRRMTGAVSDVTEQREMETRLRQSQKMETVGTLAGGIAHDFNNQLTAVLGHLTLLDQGLATEAARPEHLRLARGAAERCAELTRGLLAFSRMLPSDPRPTSANEVVHETVALLARMVPASIQVRLHLAADLPSAMVDAVQLQQVLFNLCINARDAMPDGGIITVRTRPVELKDASERGGLAPGHYAEISVLDTGVGIPADALARVFEPFFTTKPVGTGTGLGLAMVYGIVSQHHGRVEVDSEPGFGSTFRVLLPATPGEAEAPAAAAGAAPAANALAGFEVLVVDDEPLVLGYAESALGTVGCRVRVATNGDAALEELRGALDTVDAVLVDLTMPGRSVRDTLHEIREMAPGLPVVLTSGFSHLSSARAELPELPFLPKPYSPAQLVEAIRLAIQGAGSGRM